MKKRRKIKVNLLADLGDPILCPADRVNDSLTFRLLGIGGRLLVIFFATAGLALTLTSALYLSVPLSSVAMLAFLAVFALGAMSLHPLATAVGAALSVGIVAIKLLTATYGPVGYMQRLVGHGWNAIMTRLYDRGYYNVIDYRMSVPIGGSEATYVHEFVEMVTFVIALVLVLSLLRRARIIPVALVSLAVLVPVFTYNFAVNNYATLMLIAGLCGVVVLVAYDHRYRRRRTTERDKEEAMLFPDRRPPVPEDMKNRAKARYERREARRQAAIDRRQNSPFMTVEEELDDYFKKPGSKKKAKKEKTLTPSETKRQQSVAQLRRVRRYDRITRQSRAAMGGFAGSAMCLLAALLLLIPAVSVHGSFKTIDSIDDRVAIYREYVTSMLRGEGTSKDLFDYLQSLDEREPHSTLAEPLEFEEIILMEVTSQSNANVYLPSFAGLDYEDGVWEYFNDSQYVKIGRAHV